MNPTIAALQLQIEALSKRISALEGNNKGLGFSNAIPRNVETAFSERLDFLTVIQTGSVNSPSSYFSFPVSVPAAPSGTLEVLSGGVLYNLLLK